MTKIFDLVPGWIYCIVIAALAFLILGQRVQVSNAKAAVSRSAKDLSDYKLSVSETTRTLQAANERRATEQRDQQLKAQNDAKTREAGLRNDASNALAELDRLRNALRVATRRDPVPGAPSVTADQPAATQTVVFLECAAAFAKLAGEADGHASDVQTLEESWPK